MSSSFSPLPAPELLHRMLGNAGRVPILYQKSTGTAVQELASGFRYGGFRLGSTCYFEESS